MTCLEVDGLVGCGVAPRRRPVCQQLPVEGFIEVAALLPLSVLLRVGQHRRLVKKKAGAKCNMQMRWVSKNDDCTEGNRVHRVKEQGSHWYRKENRINRCTPNCELKNQATPVKACPVRMFRICQRLIFRYRYAS